MLLPERGEGLSEALLSTCRGRNQQVYSTGCESCASPTLPLLQINPIDECRCLGAAGVGCVQCQNGAPEDSQNLQNGHIQSDPGWLPSGLYACSGQLQQGTCQQDGSCAGPFGIIGLCGWNLQAYAPEGGN